MKTPPRWWAWNLFIKNVKADCQPRSPRYFVWFCFWLCRVIERRIVCDCQLAEKKNFVELIPSRHSVETFNEHWNIMSTKKRHCHLFIQRYGGCRSKGQKQIIYSLRFGGSSISFKTHWALVNISLKSAKRWPRRLSGAFAILGSLNRDDWLDYYLCDSPTNFFVCACFGKWSRACSSLYRVGRAIIRLLWPERLLHQSTERLPDSIGSCWQVHNLFHILLEMGHSPMGWSLRLKNA